METGLCLLCVIAERCPLVIHSPKTHLKPSVNVVCIDLGIKKAASGEM